jgi:DNA-binding IscR family transcriptional regulator
MCDKHETKCDKLSECVSHKVLASVTNKVNEYLGGLTLQMVMENKEFKPPFKY